MSKHTPGPWTMETVRTSCGVCFKVGPFPWKQGKLIHACIYADYPSPSSPEYHAAVANATLIAAAPELLEALSAAMAFIDSHAADPDLTAEMCRTYAALLATKPHAAIAKATS
jgi:hypothetical protein